MSTLTRKAHIAVVGGGFTGMVSAFRLLQAGYRVTIFEANSSVGGLTAPFDFGPFRWDKFYHCILTSDTALLALLADLGLSDQVRWQATNVGLFSHKTFYKMTSPADLLRYPHISLFNKVRLALATFWAVRIQDGRRLDRTSLLLWTRKLFGRQVSREFWEPLFRCKLGGMRYHASASFLWGTLKRLYSTRDKGSQKQERLGYVRGGYRTVFDRLLERTVALGASIQTDIRVTRASTCAARNDVAPIVVLTTEEREFAFDGAIFTLPNPLVGSCLADSDQGYKERLEAVTYLGLVCVVLVLKRRLSPFYVTNITDESPFTGVIEMTNLIDPELETAGFHLVYLPRYTSPGDAFFLMSDEEIWSSFACELKRMHPDLVKEDIAGRFVFRERTVQPVPTLGYREIAPPSATPCRGVFLANTAQIIDNTLNNNVMTSLANDACAELMRQVPKTIAIQPAERAVSPLASVGLFNALDFLALSSSFGLASQRGSALILFLLSALLFVAAWLVQRREKDRGTAEKAYKTLMALGGAADDATRR